MTTETQTQVVRLRAALNELGDREGGTRSREGDVAFHEASQALFALERLTGTAEAVERDRLAAAS